MVVFHRYCNLAEFDGKLVTSRCEHLTAERGVYVNVVFWSHSKKSVLDRVYVVGGYQRRVDVLEFTPEISDRVAK